MVIVSVWKGVLGGSCGLSLGLEGFLWGSWGCFLKVLEAILRDVKIFLKIWGPCGGLCGHVLEILRLI